MSQSKAETPAPLKPTLPSGGTVDSKAAPEKPKEVGGPKGLEPTRYGDWEKGGRCIDF